MIQLFVGLVFLILLLITTKRTNRKIYTEFLTNKLEHNNKSFLTDIKQSK